MTSLEGHHANDSAFRIAELHAYRGEIDQAFAWLDRAALQRDSNCMYVKIDAARGRTGYPVFPRRANSSRSTGRRRTRTPVAAKIAFATAGPINMTPSSPTPLGSSLLGTM